MNDTTPASPIFYLGIDGGGTKTALILTDEHLNILRQSRCEGCNPVDIGMAEAQKRLKTAIEQICADIPCHQISLFAGIAGGTAGDNQSQLTAFFATFGFASFGNDNDVAAIRTAGLGKQNGVTMILGTGICAFTWQDGIRSRVAGWGYLFDDGGSGYNIGRDGLTAHFRSCDGSGPATALSDALARQYPHPQTLLADLYAGGKTVIASFAALVYETARAGDPVAMDILRRNMAFAAHILETASSCLTEGPIPVVLTGGLTREALTLTLLREALTEPTRYDLRVLDCEPVWGAVLAAKDLYEQHFPKKGD